MEDSRIQQAMARIDAALLRVDAASEGALAKTAADGGSADDARGKDGSGSARVMTLINAHEKLREEVVDTLRELDAIIEDLEG